MHPLEQLRSGALAGTRRLNLSCGLRTLPPEVFDLADTLEVRAFGCLLEELGAHTLPAAGHASALPRMVAMAQACLALQPGARPSMAELAQQLATW